MRVSSLLIVLTAWCVLTNADKPKNCSKGVIVPEDPYFLDGQDIVLTCWRNDNVTARDLYFTTGSRRTRLEEKYHWRNKTHVTLRYPVTAEYMTNFRGNSAGFYCHDSRSKKDVCIQLVYAETDFYPRMPVDVRCSSYNWETMICNWDLVVDYNHPLDYTVSCDYVWLDNDSVDVELLFRLRNNTNLWGKCPGQTRTSCNWDSDHFIKANLYIVVVRVKNTVLNITTSTEEYVLETKDIVKPAAVDPSDVAVSYLAEPDAVSIQWNHSQLYQDFNFSLHIVSDCDQEKIVYVPYKPNLYVSYNEQIPAQLKLTGLNPNTGYTVNLRARPFGGTGPWSEATEISFTTLSDVPKVSPYTRDGLFEESRAHCSTVEDCMKINVYFKPLAECEILSNTTEYLVTSPLWNITMDTSASRVLLEVDGNQTSSVKLRAISEEGESTNFSQLVIHPEIERPNIVRELVIHYNPTTGDCTARVVVLKDDARFSSLSHIIVWCYSNGDPYCQEPLDWYELRVNGTLTLPVKHCKLKYRVGLSTLGYLGNKGEVIATPIHWELCMFEEGKVPKVPLPKVDTFETGADNKVQVSWTPYSCNTKDMNYVEFYEVSSCKVAEEDLSCTCTDRLLTRNVSKLHTSVTLLLNDTGHCGCVWVRAKTVAGFGPKTMGKMFNVTGTAVASFDDERRTIILGSVGGGIGLLVAILIAVLCIWCYKRIKKKIERPEIHNILGNLQLNEAATEIQATDRVRETELTIEEEAEPLISDSGTGSLTSKISTEIPETERQRNGSDDSGVHRLGNADDEEPLVALLGDNLAGSGNTYGGMPDLGEYDFDSTGFSSVGPRLSVSKTEQTGSDTEDNIANAVNANNAESSLQETPNVQVKKDLEQNMHIEEFHGNQKESSQNSKHSNEVVLNIESFATEPSAEGSISCQATKSDTTGADAHLVGEVFADESQVMRKLQDIRKKDNKANEISTLDVTREKCSILKTEDKLSIAALNPETVPGSKFIMPVNCLSEQSGQSHQECVSAINLTNEDNDLGDFNNSRELSSQNNNCEDVVKENEEDKHILTFESEPKDSQSNLSSDIAETIFHNPSPPSLSGSRDLSFEMDGSGISRRGGYTNALNVSMDFTDSESEDAKDSENSDSESNSKVAIKDLTHTHSDNHSGLSSPRNIQSSQEQSKEICDNDDIPLSKQNYDNGSSKSKPQTSNTQTEKKVFSHTSESVCSEQKDKVKSELDDDKPNTATNSYTKVKESKSGILYKSSS